MGELFDRLRPIVLVLSVAAIVVAAVVWLDRRQDRPQPLLLDLTSPPRREIRVEVSGAVASPGVLTLHAGDRVEEALEAAGGALPEADLSQVNRAAFLIDGQRVHVSSAGATAAAGMVDLNRDPAAVIEGLPGIGPRRAALIVASRDELGPFMRIEELVERRLIPVGILDELRPLVVLSP